MLFYLAITYLSDIVYTCINPYASEWEYLKLVVDVSVCIIMFSILDSFSDAVEQHEGKSGSYVISILFACTNELMRFFRSDSVKTMYLLKYIALSRYACMISFRNSTESVSVVTLST